MQKLFVSFGLNGHRHFVFFTSEQASNPIDIIGQFQIAQSVLLNRRQFEQFSSLIHQANSDSCPAFLSHSL